MPDRPITPLLPLHETAVLSLPEAARRYAAAGAAVFPLVPGTKRPVIGDSFHAATNDLAQVEAWWSWLPTANIGLRTGEGVDVLDIDVHSDGTGFDRLRSLLRSGAAAEWAQAVRSPSGGLHLYYPSDPEAPQRSWNRPKAHLDFRGTGGYITTVPSRIMAAGQPRTYTPVGGTYPGRPLPAETIKELLTPPRPVTVSGPVEPIADAELADRAARIGDWLAGFEGSNRNEALFWSACRLVEYGATESQTHDALDAAADRLGMGGREVAATIANAFATTSPDPILYRTRVSPARPPQAWSLP